jgi:RHS repeat-associated protein
MGYGWNSNYDMLLAPQIGTDLNAASTIVVSQENGSTLTFTKSPNGTYSAPLGVRATLAKSGTNFVLIRDKQTTFTFSSAGVLTSIKDLNDNTTTLNYTNGKLSTVANNKGQQLTFTWNAAGLLASVTTPTGKTTTYGYSTGKNLNKVTYPDGTTETYVHNGEHMIMDFYDRNGNKTINTYDAEKKVTAQIDALSNKTAFTYEIDSTVVTYPNGRKDEHHFNNLYQVYRIQSAVGTSDERNEYYEFDAAVNLTSVTFPDGGTIQNNYDANGNLLQTKDRAGNITSYTYNNSNLPLTKTNPAGKTQTFTYDTKGNLLSSTDFKQNSTTYTINTDGTLQKAKTPDGAETSFTYNNDGLPITTTDALLNKTTQTYNADGQKLVTTNAKNKTQSQTYDTAGRVTKTIYPNLSEETIEYDTNSNVVKNTNRSGKSSIQKFDALNRLVSTTDAAGNIMTQQYDKMGNITKIIDATGKETTATYNLLGHLTEVTDSNGKKTSYTYNLLGNLTSSTDANGGRTLYAYDANNNLIQTISPTNIKTATKYNNVGLPEKTTDVQRKTTQFTYDDNGNIIKVVHPNQFVETTNYDALNRKTQFTDSDGGIKKWAYDKLGQLISFTNTDTKVTNYTYDSVGNTLSEVRPDSTVAKFEYSDTDQVTKEIYSDSTTDFIYDSADRILKEKQGPDEVAYTYDNVGNLLSRGPPTGAGTTYTYTPRNEIASIVYPSGKKVAYTYDNSGNLLTAVNAQTGTFTYAYNDVSALVSGKNPNGTQQTYDYDASNQLTQTLLAKNSATLYQKEYNYSTNSGLVESSVTKLNATAPTINETYSYDAMSRLASNTSEETTSGEYKYSNTGNLTTKLGETQTFNAANQITATNVKTDLLYSSDVRGNRTIQRDATTKVIDRNYAYNQRNQLAGTGSYGETVHYAYDANGLLKRRTKNAVDKKFIWNYNNSVPTLLDDGDYEYIYTTSNTPTAQINKSTGVVTYLHAAETGSVVAATNTVGAVVGAYTYTAYGDIETPEGVIDLQHTQTRFGYAGEWKDPETGLYNLRARWYEPTTGAFLTRDPVEQATNEAYSYASGNPYLYTDPLGLWSWNPTEWTSAELSTVSTMIGLVALALSIAAFGPAALVVGGIAAAVSLGSAGAAVKEGNTVNVILGVVGAIPGLGVIGSTIRRQPLKQIIFKTTQFQRGTVAMHQARNTRVNNYNFIVKQEEWLENVGNIPLAYSTKLELEAAYCS